VLWGDASLPLKLQLRAAEAGWSWSGAAALDAPGESILKMRHRSRGETLLVRLEVTAARAAAGGALAVLRAVEEGGSFAPYRCGLLACGRRRGGVGPLGSPLLGSVVEPGCAGRGVL
jgi:hypothetical protein